MIRNRGPATITVAILQVGTALPDEHKTQGFEQTADLTRLEHWQLAHGLTRLDQLRADKLALQSRLPVLQQHADDLLEVLLQLVQGSALRVCARESGDVADIKPGVGTLLNYGRK
jgi:hypothetical protein